VRGSENLVLEQELESQDNAEREAQGHEDDRIIYGKQVISPGSDRFEMNWLQLGRQWLIQNFGQDDTQSI
jgi:hypothetical protein